MSDRYFYESFRNLKVTTGRNESHVNNPQKANTYIIHLL